MALSFGQHRRLLTTYLKPQRARVALLAALLLTGIGLQLLNPQAIRFFIDAAEAGGSPRALLLAALVYLVVGLLRRGLTFTTSYVGLNVAWKATNALRSDLTRHCLRLDMSFHKTHTPGEMIERVDGDALALGQFFSQMVVKTAGNALLVRAILYLLYRGARGGGADPDGVHRPHRGRAGWHAELGRQALGGRTPGVGRAEQLPGGAHRGLRRHPRRGRRAVCAGQAARHHAFADGAARGGWMANVARLQHHQLPLCHRLRARAAGIGAYLYTRGSVTIGTAFVMVYYIGMLAAPLDEIRDQAKELQQATGSVGRINELFTLQPRVPRGGASRTADRRAGCRIRGCVVRVP